MVDREGSAARLGRVHSVSFHEIGSQVELDAIFDDLAVVFARGDAAQRDSALERLEKTLWIDGRVGDAGGARDVHDRLAPFFRTVESMADLALREVLRPGVAGPFFGAIQFDLDEVVGDRVDLRRWMLDILRRRRDPEPSLPTVGIDFHAHEWLCHDPDAVRELVSLGHFSVAIEAATETPAPVMRDVLIELGNSEDPEIVRRAGWHLAYHHRTLHPRAAALGFVERFEDDDAEVFVLCARAGGSAPWAAAIYPQAAVFTPEVAGAVADRIFPPELRGAPTPVDFALPGSDWYERGYVRRWPDEGPTVLLHIGWRGPEGDWEPRRS